MGKVAAIGRDGRLMVNAQHASYSATQYARGYISEGVAVTDGLVLYLDAADYASYPGKRSLATAWVDYNSHQADYNVMGDDGVILLGTYTSWQGRFPSTTTATGNHTVTFDYWSDNDSVAWSIDNDGINNNDYNTTLTANKKKQTFSKTVNLTSTGTSTMYMRPHSTGSKVYVANYRFFENGTTWNDLSGNSYNGTITGTDYQTTGGGSFYFDGVNTDNVALPNDIGYTTAVSCFAWFKRTSNSGVAGTYHIISSSTQLEMSVHQGSSFLRNGVTVNGTRYVQNDGSAIGLDTWHHIGFTFSNYTKKAYVDGVLVGTQTCGSTGSLSYSFSGRELGRMSTSYALKGNIATYTVYNRELLLAEVKQNFNAERNRFGI